MKNIVKQAIRFIGLSGIGWILDFCTYTGLTFILSNVVVINFISSWVGVTFVFMLATRNIFKNNSKISLKWKYLIYLSYQLVLIFLISKLLGEINQWIVNNARIELMQRFSGIISKIIVTPITMVLNFIVMKNVIEKI